MAEVNRSLYRGETLTPEPDTLVELLRLRASRQPDHVAYTFLADGDKEEAQITYRRLDERARAIAAVLQATGAFGERALLLYPSGPEYVAAFLGCLYAGVIAVPAYPPTSTRRESKHARLNSIASDCQASLILCTSPILSSFGSKARNFPALGSARLIATDAIAADSASQWQSPAIDGDTLAFLQYTSGSTAEPKGVMVSHQNLLHNQRLIQHCFAQTEQSVIVGWLPLYHDMGLIGNMLHPLYLGATCALMSPTSFLQRPLRWLSAISRYRATTSGGPNFAYDLCVRRISEDQCEGLDLSHWKVAFNGAEPIRHETLERFAQKFAPYGFRPEAFAPCYGLAEATLIVSGGLKKSFPIERTLEAAALERDRIVATADASQGALKLVSCGEIAPDHSVAIVDRKSSTLCPADRVGEIWVSGPSVARGYWQQKQQTAETFLAHLADSGEGPFLRTGDLGFISDGQLFVTGRIKDLIIIRGRNLYPQDIELTVERSHEALRKGSGAAFSAEIENQEQLVVIQELEPRHQADLVEVLGAIRQAVFEQHEVQPFAVALIKAGTIPKTSSGKIRRRSCHTKFQENGFDVVAEWRGLTVTSGVEESTMVAPPAFGDAESIQCWLASQLAVRLGLDVSEIDVNLPIVRYGIDSITSIELAHSLENSLGVSVPLVSFLEEGSIAGLAAQISSGLADRETVGAVDLCEAESEAGEYPLSYGQRALWFLHQLAPESAAYNLASALSIHSELDASALRRAFQTLVDRHACLRTAFKNTFAGAPVQQTRERDDVCFEVVDATAWSETALEDRLSLEALRPFDLEQGPLLRVHLFEQSRQRHVLMIVIHHIVADLWSLAVLVNELGMLYRAECVGVQANLAPLKLHYSEYVRRETALLTSPAGERLWGYWQERLGGALPALDLPTDRPRPSVQTYSGASMPFELSEEITESLKAICRRHDATPFMGLLAAFQVLLHRYTHQEDLLVGSPTSGRNSADLAGLVGYFVNPLIFRADLSGGPTFPQFLDQVRDTVLGAFEHQEYPLALLVERLQPERDPSRSPLFQAMFILQKMYTPSGEDLAAFAPGRAGTRTQLGGLSVEPLCLSQRSAQFDLTLTVQEAPRGLAATFDYNTDLFAAATIDRMARHFQTLLGAVVNDPALRVSDCPLLTEAEHQQVLFAWNATVCDYPRESCIHQLFEQQAERTPDTLAVVFGDQGLSYGELNGRANRVAHYLNSVGVGIENRVGIFVERSLDVLIGLLGILKAGAAYVPLDPNYPRDRLLLMSEDAGLSLVLTQQRLVGALADVDAKKVCLDSDWPQIAVCSAQNPAARVTPDNLAYVIYTSGSTGKPKGVMIAHRNVVNFCTAMDERIGCERPGTWLAVTSISFDISVFELLWTVARGFQVIIQPGHESDAAQVEDYSIGAQIRRHRVSHLQCTPSLARMMTLATESLDALQTLDKLMLGGEALPVSLADQLGQRIQADIHNMYGPTETTIWSTTSLVERATARISIGRPIANTEVYIADKNMQPAPVGVPGELLIGGEGVARGYFDRPHLTADKFIPNPFAARGSRLYKTGDLTRYLPDGSIEFLGRVDHQVKVRGFRIELGEIEVTLARHPGIREAAVLAREDASGETRLVAYVVADGSAMPDASEIRKFVGEKLPEHMVPSAIVVLDQLPLTPNGKIDRKALQTSERARVQQERSFTLPRTATEEVLAVIWAEVLDLERVDIHDDFFALGGHSLLAAHLIAHVRETLKIELPLRTFFRFPTVAGLASSIADDPKQQARVERIAQLLISVAQDATPQLEVTIDD